MRLLSIYISGRSSLLKALYTGVFCAAGFTALFILFVFIFMYYVDIGNSRIKIKAYTGNAWQEMLNTDTENARGAAEFIARKGETAVGISVVPEANKVMSEVLLPADSAQEKRMEWITIDDVPRQSLDYENPESLGMDRYMACLGARFIAGKSVIVVDAGTACTIDYMDESGIFRGGVIMPGIRLWERSLQQYAPNLPQVVREKPHRWPGKSTEDSLRWGLAGAFATAVNGIVQRYDHLAAVYVTGGDAHWLMRQMERSGKMNDNLIFHGLRKFMQARRWFA